MVGLITDVSTGEPLSLHFTFLCRDGSGKAPIERQKVLLKGHRKAGGVVRLTADADVTMGLGLAEGIETALACASSGWQPVWAAVDASNIASFPVLPGIECLTVFADNDRAGQTAAQKCLLRWQNTGRAARIISPLAAGADWEDVARRVSA